MINCVNCGTRFRVKNKRVRKKLKHTEYKIPPLFSNGRNNYSKISKLTVWGAITKYAYICFSLFS